MNKALKNAVSVYEQQIESAEEKLIAKVKPHVVKACQRWGVNFCGAMGDYTFYPPKAAKWRQPMRKREGQYVPIGEPNFLIDFLEPDLLDILATSVGNRTPLGSWLDRIEVDPNNYEWVVIEADEWALDEPREHIQILPHDYEFNSDWAYYGPVPKSIASRVVQEYQEDWDSGHQLLASIAILK